jgi:hypothetical protein
MTEITSSLYDRDILLWVEDTVTKLKSHNFEQLDIENLIEEVESLGISQKKELLNRLVVLIEHLLKRLYVNLPDDYNGWERTIREQRKRLQVLLIKVPSLVRLWDEDFKNAWKIALLTVKEEYPQTQFPDRWQFSSELEPMLNDKFWQ